MLWDIVRDFFVRYIFGGYTSNGDFCASYGMDFGNDDYISQLCIKTSFFNSEYLNDNNVVMCLGDYLSTIATIISMVIIVVIACLFIKKIYNMCAHIIG